MEIICPQCHQPFQLTNRSELCSCGLKYFHNEKIIKYDYNSLLYKNYRKNFMLNKVLNNNAELSYIHLPEGSLALGHRDDVNRFKDFITNNLVDKNFLLDIGCGILPRPGYVPFNLFKNIYGLDPIDNDSFDGIRIVGSCEFMPFTDCFFDAIVFATSLDHTNNPIKCLTESHRILKDNGIVFIWMSDKSTSNYVRLKRLIKTVLMNIRKGYRTDKYFIYRDFNIFYVPKGAIDPFHSQSETPKQIKKIMMKLGFIEKQSTKFNNGEVFLAFQKS